VRGFDRRWATLNVSFCVVELMKKRVRRTWESKFVGMVGRMRNSMWCCWWSTQVASINPRTCIGGPCKVFLHETGKTILRSDKYVVEERSFDKNRQERNGTKSKRVS
jgi:hypothetical protein